jgi:uncharacterized integral membrane protein
MWFVIERKSTRRIGAHDGWRPAFGMARLKWGGEVMRIARFLIAYGLVSVLGVLVSLFLAQNAQPVQLTFFGRDVSTSLALTILAATTAGFIFALLLLVPGRIAATLHIWTLRREARELDEELVWQSERHDELLEHHERLLSGHEWLLTVYRRTRAELDDAIRERDALKVLLARANDDLATQRRVAVRREIIIPAPRRETGDSTPTAPRIQVAPRSPATATLDKADDGEEEKAALPVAAHLLPASAVEPPEVLQQAQATVANHVSDVMEGVDSDSSDARSARASFGETLASAVRSFTTRLDDWRQATSSFISETYAEGARRVDRAINQARHLSSTAWSSLKERAGSLRARVVGARRRVAPLTHPK